MTALPAVPPLPLDPPAATFLARHGLAGETLVPLTADASTRRYVRLPDRGLLLMEDRQDPVGFAAYLRLSRHLCALGLSAPRVQGADPSHGLALVEDFGTSTYTACLAAGHDERALYELAVDALLHLHHEPRGAAVSQPAFDLDTYLTELDVFSDWFAPAVAPSGFDPSGFARRFRELWAAALAPIGERRETLVLRDFHVDNLMLLEGRTGVARCGLLDFQDGVLGPCEYDLVSLLQDARRDLAPGLEAAMLQRYVAGAPAHLGPADEIRQRYALLGAQRHARIAGVFVRLSRRDGKPRYLAFLPRVLRQLETALDDAGLTDIRAFLAAELPEWRQHGSELGTDADILKGPIRV
ncbi:aminoglycoside phosphotransferase family protein [Amorphus orientalis]|uniref:Aminoglycoside/choline kinase family phosphotransferase n=1 Tax=Amorphus orientalis TaxID=649198 RepID=A0AAE3VLM6_9HYPH|nr:phosphotransferase [Amorphus orientalis]MDQ0314020.1 aminoglycoside/choline kinase family phosphotransferase [Amorphus orientalis]